jgi:hypothetical protein
MSDEAVIMLNVLDKIVLAIGKIADAIIYAQEQWTFLMNLMKYPVATIWKEIFGKKDVAKEPDEFQQPKGAQIQGSFESLTETWKRISSAAAQEVDPTVAAVQDNTKESMKQTGILTQIYEAVSYTGKGLYSPLNFISMGNF